MAEFTPNGIGVPIESADQVLERERLELEDSEGLDITEEDEGFKSALASHIFAQFTINRDAKRDSGIEEEIADSLRAYNGEYSTKDKARITQIEQGSAIFMNITATQARAAKSWMADIFQPANDYAWLLEASPNADLPLAAKKAIEDSIQREFEEAFKSSPTQPTTEQAQESIRTSNKRKRDIKESIAEEIAQEATFNIKVMERQVRDQLLEGGWDRAFLEFLEDFTVYPTAFIKGPIISRKNKLTWKNGKPEVIKTLVSLNKRVDPFDIYPSPSAVNIDDGNLIEHVRFTKKDIMDLKGVYGYDDDKIDEVLLDSMYRTTSNWVTQDWVDTEKADQERRGNELDAETGILHGLHFHGPLEVGLMRQWSPSAAVLEELEEYEDGDLVEAESILVNNEVIKCVLNSDPLGRRPYYKASFINRPGGFWGRSLPDLIRDIQRMCNAVARSLANNLAISSGPQVEVYVDRLADSGEIESMYPMKIWQLKSDPSGGGGRAINFFQPSSNAAELLKVYQEFEIRAGETIGIPRIAQGNERTAGLAATVGGLSMLLENASKVIKDAIRNVDEGVVKPRVEQEFYINILKNRPLGFTGDITVIPRGSSALTIKTAEALRRNEFLQITANPIDQGIMGTEGRAKLLKSLAKELNLPDIVPGPLELKKKEDEAKAAAQQQQEQAMQLEEQKQKTSLAATNLQIEGQKSMAMGTQQIQAAQLQQKAEKDQMDQQLKAAELQLKGAVESQKISASMQNTSVQTEERERSASREIAFKLKTGQPGI